MTTEDITSLFKTSDRLVSEVSLSHHRYLAGEIDWRNRLVCIKGARGTGKGTELKTFARELAARHGRRTVYRTTGSRRSFAVEQRDDERGILCVGYAKEGHIDILAMKGHT